MEKSDNVSGSITDLQDGSGTPQERGCLRTSSLSRAGTYAGKGCTKAQACSPRPMTAPEREKSSALISDSLKSGTQTLPHTRGGCEVLKEMTKLGEWIYTDSGRRNVVENSTG